MIIGICGKSGSGKSTISNLLMNYYEDILVVDIDKIGHESYENNEIKRRMISEFGEKVLKNDKINRKELSRIVFNSKEQMDKLTNITWDYMEKRIDSIISDNPKKIIVLDWQLLPLTKFFKMCDCKILLDIPYEIRKERSLKRDNISEEKFQEREQASINYQENDFDIIIKNSNITNIRKLVKKI